MVYRLRVSKEWEIEKMRYHWLSISATKIQRKEKTGEWTEFDSSKGTRVWGRRSLVSSMEKGQRISIYLGP